MMNTPPNQKPSNPGNWSRKIVFLYLLTVLILIAGVLEAGFRVYHYRKYGEWKSAAEIVNQHIHLGASAKDDCSFSALTFPDPYLVYVRRSLPHCDVVAINNIGIAHNKDITYKKSPDIYKLLVTGGSVAKTYARYPEGVPSLLEATLNRCYIPPNGKQRFGVWSGAIGGWRQPQQAVFTLLYGQEFDGVLSLEGYNAHFFYNDSKSRFDNRRYQLNRLPFGFIDFGSQVKIWAIGKIMGLPLIRHSHVFTWLGSVAYYARRRELDVHRRELDVHKGYYSYPQEWRAEDMAAQNKQTYLHHIRSFYHIAVGFGLDFALFIQPVPAIHKPLTKQEKAVAGDLSYKESYLEMSRRILEMNREGILTISLLDAFQHIEHSIYSDPVHYRKTDAGKQPGYEILNRKIAAHLAKNWEFQRRPDAPDSCPAGPAQGAGGVHSIRVEAARTVMQQPGRLLFLVQDTIADRQHIDVGAHETIKRIGG